MNVGPAPRGRKPTRARIEWASPVQRYAACPYMKFIFFSSSSPLEFICASLHIPRRVECLAQSRAPSELADAQTEPARNRHFPCISKRRNCAPASQTKQRTSAPERCRDYFIANGVHPGRSTRFCTRRQRRASRAAYQLKQQANRDAIMFFPIYRRRYAVQRVCRAYQGSKRAKNPPWMPVLRIGGGEVR